MLFVLLLFVIIVIAAMMALFLLLTLLLLSCIIIIIFHYCSYMVLHVPIITHYHIQYDIPIVLSPCYSMAISGI